jgi:hypothetical protein
MIKVSIPKVPTRFCLNKKTAENATPSNPNVHGGRSAEGTLKNNHNELKPNVRAYSSVRFPSPRNAVKKQSQINVLNHAAAAPNVFFRTVKPVFKEIERKRTRRSHTPHHDGRWSASPRTFKRD